MSALHWNYNTSSSSSWPSLSTFPRRKSTDSMRIGELLARHHSQRPGQWRQSRSFRCWVSIQSELKFLCAKRFWGKNTDVSVTLISIAGEYPSCLFESTNIFSQPLEVYRRYTSLTEQFNARAIPPRFGLRLNLRLQAGIQNMYDHDDSIQIPAMLSIYISAQT